MRHILSDLRYAVRTLVKTPLAMMVTVVSLALGIGAATFVFSTTSTILFQSPGGVTTAENLVTVYTSEVDGDLYGGNSFPDYRSIVEEVPALEEAAAVRFGTVNLSEAAPPRPLFAEIVTGNYFDVLGITLPLGRAFLPDESQIGGARRVVVISHRFWQDHFGGNRNMLGRTVRLDGHAFTVIGVAPQGMVSRLLSLHVDVWVPLGIPGGTFRATPKALTNRGDRDFQVIARLDKDATLAQAEAQLTILARRLRDAYPDVWQDNRGEARTVTILNDAEGGMPPTWKAAFGVLSALLFGIAGMILLIACSNVAGIFLARANHRRREMAIRISLGAGRRRLVMMLLTESLLPALSGGALGIAIAVGATRSLNSVRLPLGVPLEFDFALDLRVLAFATLLAVAASLLFGLAPALEASRPDLIPSLKNVSGTAGKRPGRFGMRNFLVVAQVASSVALLVVAGIAIRTLQATTAMDLGFSPDRVAVMSKRLANEGAPPAVMVLAAKDLMAHLASLPDVEAANISRVAEGTILSNLANAEIRVDGLRTMDREMRTVGYNTVTPGYLTALQIAVLRGRTFAKSDVAGRPPVAVVNQALVDRFWPGSSGLGNRFTITNRRMGNDLTDEADQTLEVVGVVANGRFADIEDANVPYFWTSFFQTPYHEALIQLKGRTSAESVLQLLRTEVRLEDDEHSMVTPTTYDEMVAVVTSIYRLVGQVLGSCGLFGLILVFVGIYGVVSLAVTSRTREVAIRQAVGARQTQVIGTVAREGITLSVVGAAVGTLIAAALSRVGDSAVFGVSPLDPVAFAVPLVVLLSAAIAASLIPARRLTKLDLMQTLREE
jgi:predicted permease